MFQEMIQYEEKPKINKELDLPRQLLPFNWPIKVKVHTAAMTTTDCAVTDFTDLKLCFSKQNIHTVLTCKHTDNRQEDLFNRLNRTPSLGTALISHGIISRGVKYGNTYSAIRVH